MTCKQCGGIMAVDKERELFICPFCGTIEPFDSLSKEELQEMLDDALSDVRADTRQIKETLKGNQTDSSIKYALSLVFFSIAALVFIIFACYGFDSGSYMLGTVSLLQFACILFAIIFKVAGKSQNKPKLSIVSSILAGITLSLVIVWFIALMIETPSSKNRRDNKEPDPWPTIGMGSDLPEPEQTTKDVYNTDKYFHARLLDTDKAGFEDYIKACKKAGYDIDAVFKDYKYIAYNENGDELELSFYYDSEVNVTLEKALEFTDFYWPRSGGLQDVPAPEADKINVESLSNSSVRLTVGTVTKDYFMQYIEELKEAGFTGNYDDNENQYYGEKGNYHVRITLKRGNLLYFDAYDLS